MIDIILLILLLIGPIILILGIKKPIIAASYAISMIPIQLPCPFFSMFKLNEYAIIIWFMCALILIIKKSRFNMLYPTKLFLIVLMIMFLVNILQIMIYGNINTFVEFVRFFIAIMLPISIISIFADDFICYLNILLKKWYLAATFCSIYSIINILLQGASISSYFMAFQANTHNFYNLKFLASPFFSDPNNYAGYLSISIGISFYVYKYSKNHKILFGVLLQILSLYFSLSRGAYIACTVSLCLVMIIRKKSRIRGCLLLAICAIAGIIYLSPYLQGDTSAMSRLNIWETAFDIFKSNPIIGVGLGNFTALFKDFVSNDLLIYNPYTHNLFLKILTELGAIGEIVFLIFCYINIQKNINRIRNCDLLSQAFLFGILCFLFQGFTVEYFSSNYFWCVFIFSFSYNFCINHYDILNEERCS